MALQQQLVEITERAQQLAVAENQQVTIRDMQASAAMTEARDKAEGPVSLMREDFYEARAEFLRQNLLLRHYENMEMCTDGTNNWR